MDASSRGGAEEKTLVNRTDKQDGTQQRILVFQQNGGGESKIQGIRRFGGDRFDLRVVSIDRPLPPVLDDTGDLLPPLGETDLVLDFLAHPDLSQDLCRKCADQGIPVVASGKKHRIPGVITPPT